VRPSCGKLQRKPMTLGEALELIQKHKEANRRRKILLAWGAHSRLNISS